MGPRAPIGGWTGNEWERFVQDLLKQHYGPGDYQEVPDSHVGDFGIEGFGADGAAYQCYCPEGVLSAQVLFERQRDKITADIQKFIQNRSELTRLFGGTKIRRWILVVPVHTSARLVQHATTKTHEVKQAQLPYAASDFEIRIATDDSFAVARATLASAGVGRISVRVPEPGQHELVSWAADNSTMLTTLQRKLAKVPVLSDESQRSAAVQQYTQAYLYGQAALAQIHGEYPEVYEAVIGLQAARERVLSIQSLTSTEQPSQTLKSVVDSFGQQLSAASASLTAQMVSVLVLGVVADWLMRCPLDFPKVS